MKRKIFATMLVASMMAGLLVGCGSDDAGSNAGSTADSNTGSSTESNGSSAAGSDEGSGAASGDVVEINVTRATFNLATPDSDQVQKVEDAINAYIADKINVKINLTDIGSGEYADKANLALGNNEINLLWTASWQSTIGTNDLVPKNAVYDITDLLPGTDLYNSMDESQWEATKYNGRNYFIPVYKDNVEGYDFMFR